MQARLRTVAVREIMTADPVTVPASVARFPHDLLPWLRHPAFPVVEDGETVGLVTVRRVNQVPRTNATGPRCVRWPARWPRWPGLPRTSRPPTCLPRLNACFGRAGSDVRRPGSWRRPTSAGRWSGSAGPRAIRVSGALAP